jgi:hypothetical protein
MYFEDEYRCHTPLNFSASTGHRFALPRHLGKHTAEAEPFPGWLYAIAPV